MKTAAILFLIGGVGVGTQASAQSSRSAERGSELARYAGADHLSLTMGFLGGQRAFGRIPLSADGASIDSAALEGEPFDRVAVFGLRYDFRLVVSHVRMTLGADVPFASFQSASTRRETPQGVRSVDSLRAYALRFGLGGEYAFGRVAPYLDLIGAVHWVRSQVSVDSASATFKGTGFGFSARAGVRVLLRRWFFANVGAEAGIVGPTWWSAEVGVGFYLSAFGI